MCGPGAGDGERARGAAPDRIHARAADALLRGRGGARAAALRARRPAGGTAAARDARLVAAGARRGHGGGGARDRLQRRPDAADPARLVHELAAAAHRGDGLGGAPARFAARRRRNPESAEGAEDLGNWTARLRRRARDHRHRPLAEHAGRHAAHARRPARQGRPGRLLDVLVHQLPAHAAAPAGVVRRVPQGRARDRGRTHARVRVRARARQRRGRREAAARDMACRARQRLRDVDGVLERVLARRLSDRQARRRPRDPLRRRRLQPDGACDRRAARRDERGTAGPERDTDRADDARDVPRPAATRPQPLRRLEARHRKDGGVHARRRRAAERDLVRRRVDAGGTDRDRRPRCAAGAALRGGEGLHRARRHRSRDGARSTESRSRPSTSTPTGSTPSSRHRPLATDCSSSSSPPAFAPTASRSADAGPGHIPDASRSALPFRWAAIRSRYHSKLPFGTRSCVG